MNVRPVQPSESLSNAIPFIIGPHTMSVRKIMNTLQMQCGAIQQLQRVKPNHRAITQLRREMDLQIEMTIGNPPVIQ